VLCKYSKSRTESKSYLIQNQPNYLKFLNTYLNFIVSCHGGLRSATTSNLVIPRCRLSTYGTRAFSVAGPVCWNSLPDYLKSSDLSLSFNCFRQQLKTFLFCKYWHQSQHYFITLETLLMRSTNARYSLTYINVIYTAKGLCFSKEMWLSVYFTVHVNSQRLYLLVQLQKKQQLSVWALSIQLRPKCITHY